MTVSVSLKKDILGKIFFKCVFFLYRKAFEDVSCIVVVFFENIQYNMGLRST